MGFVSKIVPLVVTLLLAPRTATSTPTAEPATSLVNDTLAVNTTAIGLNATAFANLLNITTLYNITTPEDAFAQYPEGASLFDALAAFEKETNLVGSATSEHVSAYYVHKAAMADIECHNETYQMLSHGRFLRANYTQALKYGHVYGNITAKSGSCVTKGMTRLNTSNQKRFFGALFANAALWFSGISFAGQLFNAACQITNQFNQHSVGRPVCIGASILTAMGGGSNLWQAWNTAQTAVTRTPSFNDYGVWQTGSGYQVELQGLSDRSTSDFDWESEMPGMLHGYENRNLTWAEFYGANITHPGSYYYDGSRGGIAMPIQFFHQPHPTNASRMTTHLGVDLTGKSIRKREMVLRKRQNPNDQNTWCNGGPSVATFGPPENDVPAWEVGYCDEDDNSGESADGGAGALYYGFDSYAPNENSALGWDMGLDDSGDQQGFQEAYDAVYEQVSGDQIWESCVCMQENGQWTNTGSLQYSWDDTYNGYSECWNANCDGGGD
ncbi:hypothetical protein T069G_09294 [Trichoderma breve]|uniref:Uncharacterized protein n=1 Tax=Trichoderma breve TaxID=2034170 RepID=A0A9W9BAB6_9HYPO|nr:hypothetical protein T069G_09294 [Trichoderma breve]KAJ4855926.1 hypothetical protein T069G_09294 [Trichoderma breve]